MKTNIKKLFIVLTIAFAVAIIPVSIHAQGPPPPPEEEEDPDAPIDGGLSLLIAGGIGYGAKKAYAMRKKKGVTDSK